MFEKARDTLLALLLALADQFVRKLWIFFNGTRHGTLVQHPAVNREETLKDDTPAPSVLAESEELAVDEIPAPKSAISLEPNVEVFNKDDMLSPHPARSSKVIRLTKSNTRLVQQLTESEKHVKAMKEVLKLVEKFLGSYLETSATRSDLLDLVDRIEAASIDFDCSADLVKRLEELVDTYSRNT